MEAFPQDYIAHNVPLIFLSGIGQEAIERSERSPRGLLQDGGFRIRRDSPAVTGRAAEEVLKTFYMFGASRNGLDQSPTSSKDGPGPFKFTNTGQVGQITL